MSASIFRVLGQPTAPRSDAPKKPALPRGTYSFVNRQSGTAVEMTSDHTVVGMPPKDTDAQKWEIHPLGAGHSIRNLKYGKYLSIRSVSKEALVLASDYPVAWQIKEIRVTEENATFLEVRWPGTDFVFELADMGSSTPKTKIYLGEAQQSTTDQQRCRYWRANRIRQNSFYQPSPQAATQNQGNSAGSSLFGFVERWKPVTPTKKVQIA